MQTSNHENHDVCRQVSLYKVTQRRLFTRRATRSLTDRPNVQTEANLGMFRMFGRTGVPQKGAPQEDWQS